MSFHFNQKKINNVVIDPIQVNQVNPKDILGYDVIPMLYSNIFICGRKGSGKTNVLFTIMQHCIGKNTNVVVFCNTCNSDKNWISIRKWLENKKQPHVFYTDIYDDGVSRLGMLIDMIKENDASELEKKENKTEIEIFGRCDLEKPLHKKEYNNYPKYFIVLDDISGELRSKKDVQMLIKHMIYYKCKIAVCSQFPNDIDPATRTQIDFWMLFKGFGKEKLEEVYPQFDFRDLEFEGFYEIYKEVTKIPHNFLYIDRDNNELRNNFDSKIILPKQN